MGRAKGAEGQAQPPRVSAGRAMGMPLSSPEALGHQSAPL